MSTWTVTYDNGEDLESATASGKLSLDTGWMFVIDMARQTPAIVLAVPSWRVVTIREGA